MATGSETTLGRKASADYVCDRMKPFQIDRINKIAPYKVKVEGKQYVFDTAHGLRYEVRFFEEQPIGGCEAARNRLFIRWFKQSAQPDRFTIRSASTTIEGQGFYVRSSHQPKKNATLF
ncbi:MAG: hypothetical protein II854_03670 [Prevotella sp.]|nr:hypothetical protein [Prevotella sp.]